MMATETERAQIIRRVYECALAWGYDDDVDADKRYLEAIIEILQQAGLVVAASRSRERVPLIVAEDDE